MIQTNTFRKTLSCRLRKLTRAVWNVTGWVADRPSVILEPLDKRQLLSVSMIDGQLLVVGTDADDSIMFSLNARDRSLMNVNDNGVVSQFPVGSIKSIRAWGLQGNDVIQVNEGKGVVSIEVLFGGGKGNDTVIGGSGGDTLRGGMNDDLLVGRFGPDWIAGGKGDDRVTGDYGHDTVYGGEGNDQVSGGPGTNAVDAGPDQSPSQVTGFFDLPRYTVSANIQPNFAITTISGYDPSQIRRAYNFGDLSDSQFTNRGRGQTIAIVNAFYAPTLTNDLAVFSSTFGLPAPSADNLEIKFQNGRPPAVDTGWAIEATLDVQWAHAIAPDAKKLMYFADSNAAIDLFPTIDRAAADVASRGGGVVSLSLGANGDPTAGVFDEIFGRYPTVTFVAAAGNLAGTISNPANNPNLLSVGGTRIFLDQDGNRIGEEVAAPWTSGGESGSYPVPSYQQGLTNPDTGFLLSGRGVPDVSYNVEDYAIYITTSFGNGNTGWFPGGVDGTSVATPQWAALLALVNEQRTQRSLGTLGTGANAALYALRGDNNLFRDIIDGAQVFGSTPDNDNAATGLVVNTAAPGYDLATGIGTPRATSLIAALSGVQQTNFLNTDFEWKGIFFSPGDDAPDTLLERNPLLGEPRGGTGQATGGSRIELTFESVPNKYTNLGQAVFDQIITDQLFRSEDNRVYGFLRANINDEDLTGEPWDVVVMTLRLEGQITVDANGREHIKAEFWAIDPSTGVRIPKSPFQRPGGVGPTLGTYFEGSLEG